jgi:hypothetical protein
MEEFNERFAIATGNIFKGIDLTQYHACISGSILIPCVHKSPLERIFENFKEYLEYYYPGYESMLPNMELQETFGYNLLADIDIAIRTNPSENYDELATALIEKIKANDPNIKLNIVSNHKNMKKYQLSGGNLIRPMEIFHIFNSSHIKMVKRFHLPTVRMYYDGDTVFMLRSCIAALLSGVCDSYKWFSSNKIAADVMLKYAQRGISIILNENERKIVQEYIKSNGRWKKLPTDKWFGVCNLQHIFFYPDQWHGGIRYGLKDMSPKIDFYPIKSFNVSAQPNFNMKIGNTLVYDTIKIYPPNQTLLMDYCNLLYSETNSATLDDVYTQPENTQPENTQLEYSNSTKETPKEEISGTFRNATKEGKKETPKEVEENPKESELIKNTTLEEKNTHMKHETTVERIGTNLVQFKAPEINNEWSDDEYTKIDEKIEYDD